MSSSALWLYEFKSQMVSGYSTLVKFQSGTRKIRDLHYNLITALPSPKQKLVFYKYFCMYSYVVN